MHRHYLPTPILWVFCAQLAQRCDAAIAFQDATVNRDERRLKTAVIARNGIQQGLELGQTYEHLNDLFFVRPTRQSVSQVGARQPRIVRVKFESVEFNLNHAHAQLRATDG
jgi:hypothetical protein